MKTCDSSGEAAGREPAAASSSATSRPEAASAFAADPRGHGALQRAIDRSPHMVVQRRMLQALFGPAPVQRQGDGLEDEAPVQGRMAPLAQRVRMGEDDELPVQGRFAGVSESSGHAVQRQAKALEDELPVQARMDDVAQREAVEDEDDALLQGRFEGAAVQRVEALPASGKAPAAQLEAACPGAASAVDASVNETGMPDQLKAGIESLSGMDMSDVHVHRNSDKPTQLNALAYAQGDDIYLETGQEQHLPHEAWHVVQQRQGRVRETVQMAGVGVNDDGGLEAEADRMGSEALAQRMPTPGSAASTGSTRVQSDAQGNGGAIAQRKGGDKWALAPIEQTRTDLDATAVGRAYAFEYDHGPEAGFGTALHHHISRAKMSEVSSSVKASLERHKVMARGDPRIAYKAAIATFETAVKDIAAAAGLESPSLEKLLHNLPLNLHYGPAIVKDDPGSAFDPSTRPKANTDGERELEPTSAALLDFLDTYQAALDALDDDGDGALTAKNWTDLAQKLQAAQAAYARDPNVVATDHGKIAVNREQWIKSADSDTWAKRGESTWPALATAQQRFVERTQPLPAAGAAVSAHHDFQIQPDAGAPVDIRIAYTNDSLVHFCNRHTYRHFDPAQIKLLNTFFASGTDQAAVALTAQAALADIEAHLRARMRGAGEPSHEITGSLAEALGDEGLGFTVNGLMMTVTDSDDVWGGAFDAAVELVQLVPTGAAYESYDAALLASLNLV